MACPLLGAKPVSKPIMTFHQSHPKEPASIIKTSFILPPFCLVDELITLMKGSFCGAWSLALLWDVYPAWGNCVGVETVRLGRETVLNSESPLFITGHWE